MNRRSFLASAALGAGALASPMALAAGKSIVKPRVRLAISSYSYWHFREPKVSIEQVVEKASALGVAGVDVLHRQMDLPERSPLEPSHRAYLARLKRHAASHGVSYCCLSIHQDFVDPAPAFLAREVAHTEKCLEIAYALGIGVLRINSGRWNTIPDFDDLMKARGLEPVLPGHTEDEGFKWCIDSLQRCERKAAELGIILAVENHWGLSRTPDGQLRIINGVRSPWVGALMDTGNFLENPYDKLAAIAPRTVFVQAKTYPGGGEWYTLKLDYRRIARILADAGYGGWVSLEMEGREPADTGVPKSLAQLRTAFGVS